LTGSGEMVPSVRSLTRSTQGPADERFFSNGSGEMVPSVRSLTRSTQGPVDEHSFRSVKEKNRKYGP
jgi:hypothetical protein